MRVQVLAQKPSKKKKKNIVQAGDSFNTTITTLPASFFSCFLLRNDCLSDWLYILSRDRLFFVVLFLFAFHSVRRSKKKKKVSLVTDSSLRISISKRNPIFIMDIHRCRFVPFNPQAINALAFSHPPSADLAGRGVPTLRLAVGRANGDVEIWNPLRGAWFQETVLRGGKDRSIEGLTWTLDPPEDGTDGNKIPGRLRLFSIGYSTAVTEWDLEKGRPLRHSSGNYGEIWCLAAQPRWQPTQRGKDGKLLPPAEGEYTGQHLAAGCADGSIVILSTADEDLKFLRLMRPSTKRARVLSVTFQNRNTIVAGYADSSIRLFDIRTGQLLRTISLGKGPAGGPKELLVWSVKCLPDGTIVSGDSAGEIRFWDGKNYSLIQRVQGHLADTLDIAVSANGDTVVSGGADQRTVIYRKKEEEKGDKKARWAEVMHRRYHTHDVKTFAVYETKDISFVVSGGMSCAGFMACRDRR